jgi:hypothetical protein
VSSAQRGGERGQFAWQFDDLLVLGKASAELAAVCVRYAALLTR